MTALLLSLLGCAGELMGETGKDAFGLLAGARVEGQKDVDRRLTAVALKDVALKMREGNSVRPEVRAS